MAAEGLTLAWPVRLAPDGRLAMATIGQSDDLTRAAHVVVATQPGTLPTDATLGLGDLAGRRGGVDPQQLAEAVHEQMDEAGIAVPGMDVRVDGDVTARPDGTQRLQLAIEAPAA